MVVGGFVVVLLLGFCLLVLVLMRFVVCGCLQDFTLLRYCVWFGYLWYVVLGCCLFVIVVRFWFC